MSLFAAIEPCESSPCINGVCYNGGVGFLCVCNAGWEGATCNQGKLEHPCISNGMCYYVYNGSCVYAMLGGKRPLVARVSLNMVSSKSLKLFLCEYFENGSIFYYIIQILTLAKMI